MGSLRAFIAVEPDAVAHRWLGRFLEALREREPRLRWVKPEHLHLTLSFLGNVAEDRVEAIARVCEEASRGAEPFRLEFGPCGWFGRRRSPRTLWLGFLPGPGLSGLVRLQAGLEAALGGLGFPVDGRGWAPHLTLGRNPRMARIEGWEALLPPWPGEGAPALSASALRLYASELTRDGPIHRVLGEFPLRRNGVRPHLGSDPISKPISGGRP